MTAKQIEQIILTKFKARAGYGNSFIITEAAQAVAAAQTNVSGLVEALEDAASKFLRVYNDESMEVHHLQLMAKDGAIAANKALSQHREGKQSPVDPLAHWPKWKRDIFYKMVDEHEASIHPPKGEE